MTPTREECMSDREPQEPRVGIFWLYNGKVIIDSTPLSEAEPDFGKLGHATGHIDQLDCTPRAGRFAD
jgi:hypothetical protein